MMNISDVQSIALTIISSIGVAGVLIFGLSSFLSKVWVNRILEKDKLKYTSELEKIKTNYQQDNLKFSMYFEEQFKIYNNLWVSLVELEFEVDKLWKSATKTNLQSFMQSLKKAKKQIKYSALLIEKKHYKQILDNFEAFENYKVGKEKLLKEYTSYTAIDTILIRELIQNNEIQKVQILSFIDNMLNTMRIQIGGN